MKFHKRHHTTQGPSAEECGFQLKELKIGDKGVIQTPNYPSNYPPDIQCIWWLKVSNVLYRGDPPSYALI